MIHVFQYKRSQHVAECYIVWICFANIHQYGICRCHFGIAAEHRFHRLVYSFVDKIWTKTEKLCCNYCNADISQTNTLSCCKLYITKIDGTLSIRLMLIVKYG